MIDADRPLALRLAIYTRLCQACGYPDEVVHMLGMSALELQRLEDIDRVMAELQNSDHGD